MIDIKEKVNNWILGKDIDKDYYCETRDIFQAHLDKMLNDLLNSDLVDDDVYMISAIVGEIGNNSFDHNIGSWIGQMGIFFAYTVDGKNLEIVLADVGQGIFNTLKKVKPSIENDTDALYTAFNEKISGRAPESRGNGLKFVKEGVKDKKIHLIFSSGKAEAKLNNKIEIIKTEKHHQGCLAIINY